MTSVIVEGESGAKRRRVEDDADAVRAAATGAAYTTASEAEYRIKIKKMLSGQPRDALIEILADM